jgi:uncharacterized protein with FMN-binding domain
MKMRILVIAGTLATAVFVGCGGGLMTVNPRAYLSWIPVRMPDLSAKAGTFLGEYTLVLPSGAIAAYRHCAVSVDVSGAHAITAITITDADTQQDAGFQRMESDVIGTQSLNVDAVTGASYTSKAFLKAVENALSH